MNEILLNYINDTNNPQNNYALAEAYNKQGQTASALGLYLRTAEKTDNQLLQYMAIINAALCLEKQGMRVSSVKTLLLQAVCVLPECPDAYYFLSRLYQYQEEWIESYTMAVIGIGKATQDSIIKEYLGKYVLLFQKAVAAWWIGRCDESRELFYYLKNNVVMDKKHSDAVDKNIQSIGLPKESEKGDLFDD